ncbi:TadE/TadG family type IV pilus assembly protein [Marinobacterium arenosum]|uniref:TadE/TadG family type IV pilus assembly protein n=1 Tax=Marinobacterium arenosum TaxID=2862496 RepID=UPI001C97138B|nr:TadE/TadG family type IV pilus assembly protein [Marinobacterium arenosum]MBY4675736.1 pilus assembly protein [Marinobacterium arenosum]
MKQMADQLNRALGRQRQGGAVMVLVAIALIGLLAATGLALDSGHMLLTKTRLQNAVDASALSAAKELWDNDGDMVAATAQAITTLESNFAAPGNEEIQDAYAAGNLTIAVEYSDTLAPFTPSATPPFVRVRVENMELVSWFVQAVGFNDKEAAASAVAGPSVGLDAGSCDLMPILACGCDPDDAGCTHGEVTGADGVTRDYHFGYEFAGDSMQADFSNAHVVKYAAGDSGELGAGNFRLLRISEDQQGGADIRERLAVAGDECLAISDEGDESTYAETEPGNTVGPVVQGLNTRFFGNTGGGPDLGPEAVADNVPTVQAEFEGVEQADGSVAAVPKNGATADQFFDYGEYKAESAAVCVGGCDPLGVARREMVLPIGVCDGDTNGHKPVEILGYACFFLLQPVSQQGNQAHVFGQFYKGCNTAGSFSMNPPDDDSPLPSQIVLYRDTGSGDS